MIFFAKRLKNNGLQTVIVKFNNFALQRYAFYLVRARKKGGKILDQSPKKCGGNFAGW